MGVVCISIFFMDFGLKRRRRRKMRKKKENHMSGACVGVVGRSKEKGTMSVRYRHV